MESGQGNEPLTCPQDCGAPPPGRPCLPQDQREYQTLLLSGSSAGSGAGAGRKLLVIDTGVNKDHLDLNVSFCRDTTSRKIRNNRSDTVGHGALFLAAAGNNGPGGNSISCPAAYPNVVAVGMLDAVRIASRMSSRGIDDGNDATIGERELELTGGGFVIESTSMDGCYEIMSGTSMSAPSVAGFAAVNWQGTLSATRALLRTLAVDIDNSTRLPGYDDTEHGLDRSTGYGLPRP